MKQRVSFTQREVQLFEKALIHMLSSPDYRNQDIIQARADTLELIKKVREWK